MWRDYDRLEWLLAITDDNYTLVLHSGLLVRSLVLAGEIAKSSKIWETNIIITISPSSTLHPQDIAEIQIPSLFVIHEELRDVQ